MKKTKIIVPALGMLLLSTAASVTGTVAWFSSNALVTVNGMSVTTKVDSNLLIADVDGGFVNADDSAYTTGPLAQARTGRLLPVSTTTGTAFFYHATNNISAVGAATDTTFVAYNEAASLSNTTAGKTQYDSAFQTNYGVTSVTTSNVIYGYIDYTFYLKATNASDSSAAVKLTECNLLYNDVALDASDRAWRVGLFVEKVAPSAAGAAVGSLVSILTPSNAANFTPGQAVTSTSARAAVTYNAAANIDSALAGGSTQRYKVVVRLWLEGEDTSCNNDTYASLTSSYTLGLSIKIGGNENAVTGIGSVAA